MKKSKNLKASANAEYQPNRQRPGVKKIGPIVLILTLKSSDNTVQQTPQTTRSNPNNPVAVQTVVADITPALVVNGNVRPTKFTITVSSTAAGSVDATISFFNNDAFTASSSDAAHTVFSYSDGWAGKFFDRMLAQAGDLGIQCYGFNVSCKDQNGLPNTDGINAMLASMLYYTGFGNKAIPSQFDLNGLERKSDQKSGLETVKVKFRINALSQFQYSQPLNRVFQFTFFFQDFNLQNA